MMLRPALKFFFDDKPGLRSCYGRDRVVFIVPDMSVGIPRQVDSSIQGLIVEKVESVKYQPLGVVPVVCPRS